MSELDDSELLADLLIRWEDAWDQGEDLTAKELCGDRFDLIDQLQQNIDALKHAEWMKQDPGSFASVVRQEPVLSGVLANRYRIEKLVGEGGHGRVYEALDEELLRTVAIKVASSLKATPDLLDEARRVAKLRHSNIVAVFDVGRHDDQLFVVSELIDGRTLADEIDIGPMSLSACLDLTLAVAGALQYAHENGFVHRDIKPSNILIDSNGQPHVADFGIAATFDDLTTGRSGSAGTLAYMSPEQLAGENHLVDQRTDVYALGVVLYQMLTGQLPFKARTPLALREQVLLRTPAPLRGLVPDASKALESLCSRLLAKHPSDRFQNMAEVIQSLQSCRAPTKPSLAWKSIVLGLGIAGVFLWNFSGPRTDAERTDQATEPEAITGDLSSLAVPAVAVATPNVPKGSPTVQAAIPPKAQSFIPTSRPLTELNTKGDERGPWLSPDGLTIYWWLRPTLETTESEIWTADREQFSSPFKNKRRIGRGEGFTLTGDQLEMILLPGRDKDLALHVAKRRSIDMPFDYPELIEEFQYEEFDNPYLSTDGLFLVLETRSGGYAADFSYSYRSDRSSRWSKPQRLPLPLGQYEGKRLRSPFLSMDGRSLWCSIIDDRQTAKGASILTWRRDSPVAPFDTPKAVQGEFLKGDIAYPCPCPISGEIFYVKYPKPGDLYVTVTP